MLPTQGFLESQQQSRWNERVSSILAYQYAQRWQPPIQLFKCMLSASVSVGWLVGIQEQYYID